MLNIVNSSWFCFIPALRYSLKDENILNTAAQINE